MNYKKKLSPHVEKVTLLEKHDVIRKWSGGIDKVAELKNIMTINWSSFYIIIDAKSSTNENVFKITPDDF